MKMILSDSLWVSLKITFISCVLRNVCLLFSGGVLYHIESSEVVDASPSKGN